MLASPDAGNKAASANLAASSRDAYVCPAPGFYSGRDGKPAAPDVLRQPVGRVAFANAELHGHQNWRDATAEGKQAAEQLFGA